MLHIIMLDGMGSKMLLEPFPAVFCHLRFDISIYVYGIGWHHQWADEVLVRGYAIKGDSWLDFDISREGVCGLTSYIPRLKSAGLATHKLVGSDVHRYEFRDDHYYTYNALVCLLTRSWNAAG